MSVKCPKCRHENPDDTIYCGKCATQLLSPEDIEVTETIEAPKEELARGATFAGRYEIIEELGKKKGKTKFYFNDLAKILGEKPRAAKKFVSKLVEEEVLEIWSSGSTSLYGLKGAGKQAGAEHEE